MITLQNVNKYYQVGSLFKKKKKIHAVKNLSLQIEQGLFGLIGLNGAGKTTTLKMMSTLLEPDHGYILLDGMDTCKYRKKLKHQINMIAGSERLLYWRLTGYENLEYFSALYHLTDKKQKQYCMELLERVGLLDVANTRVEQYSKGMKQRLQIARGLINKPKYLYMDEPTVGLDVKIAREIRLFIKDNLLKDSDRHIILTSHYMNEIEEMCNIIGILDKGELIFHGILSDLFKKFKLSQIHKFSFEISEKNKLSMQRLKNFPWQYEIEEIDEVISILIKSDDDIVADVIRFLHKAGLEHISYSPKKFQLEDVILMMNR